MSRLLFVAASPAGWMPVNFALEHRGIDNAIERSRYRDQLERSVQLQADLGDIFSMLDKYRPDIVHFVGHGTENGEVVLARGPEEEQLLVRGNSIYMLFEPFAKQVKLVVLNACHTAALAERLAQRVGCAIGMRREVLNSEASAFAEMFYGALGSGVSVKMAFKLAADSLGEHRDIPVLYCPNENAAALYFVPRWRRSARSLLALAALTICVLAALWAVSSGHPKQTGPTRMVLLDGGDIRLGSSRGDVESAYAECLREYPTDGEAQCGKDLEASPFQRETMHSTQSVTVRPFLLDAHEVTNEQFAAWLTQHREEFTLITDPARLAALDLPGPVVSSGRDWLACVQLSGESSHRAIAIRATAKSYEAAPQLASHPVRLVSWQAATAYCAAQRKRLPTAIEWEWAARGAESRSYPWGEEAPRCDNVAFGRRSGGACPELAAQTVAAASGSDVTRDGVFDLGGNVSEWTASSFSEADVDQKEIRGGYYQDATVFLAGARRFRGHQLGAYVHVGFRCAKDFN